jgi:type I restriction enzyme S subunit
MTHWPTKPIGEICQLINGRAFKPNEWENAGIPIIRIQNLNDSTKPFNYTTKNLPEKFKVHSGDTLLSWSGTPGTSFGCFRWDGPVGWLNQHIFKVVLREEVMPAFFIHQVNSKLGELIGKAHGGVGLQHITKGALSSVSVATPPLPEQERIVKLLNEADQLRKLRADIDRRTADVAPAIFHEMFEAKEDFKGWRRLKLVELCEASDDIRCGPFGTQLQRSEYQTSGVPLWGIKHVNSHFSVPTHEFVTLSKAADLANYSLLPNDIVMTRKATVGNCTVYPSNFQPGIMHSDLLRIRVMTASCTPDFLSNALGLSREVKQQVESISSGATTKGINVSMLKRIAIHLPPLGLQNQFTRRISEIRRLQAEQTQTRKHLEDLFQSMIHRAFQGDL